MSNRGTAETPGERQPWQHSPLCSGNGVAPNPGCSCGLVEWLYCEATRNAESDVAAVERVPQSPSSEAIAALSDDDLSVFVQRCRAHPTAGYFDVTLVRAALKKLFGGSAPAAAPAGQRLVAAEAALIALERDPHCDDPETRRLFRAWQESAP